MATVSPLTGAATRKGSSPAGTIGCGQATRACCPRRDCKGQSPAARPLVAAARCKASRGSPTVKAAAYKGDRWQERPPARVVLPEGNNTYHRGGCPHRRLVAPPPAHGSGGGDDADWGKERARASF
ncbi:hypothetical protein GW17_00047768 [Ensete ventricosum]|nr:hypothetical protein GW17_00047768 [Ensete ventricosum]